MNNSQGPFGKQHLIEERIEGWLVKFKEQETVPNDDERVHYHHFLC